MKKLLKFIVMVTLILSMATTIGCNKNNDQDEKFWSGFYSLTE